MDRIANITGIPEINSENLQMLRYETGQFYKTHNDYIPYQIERQSGVRIATFYIYLNDVEEGGT
jgi:prolyl 4-hydroxylase